MKKHRLTLTEQEWDSIFTANLYYAVEHGYLKYVREQELLRKLLRCCSESNYYDYRWLLDKGVANATDTGTHKANASSDTRDVHV